MKCLKDELKNFRDITLDLINCLEADKYDEITNLLNQRQEIIDNINSLNYKSEEFIEISNMLDIKDLEERLKNIMKDKYKKTRDQLKSAVEGKNIRANYMKSIKESYVDSIFLSRKI